MTKDNQRTILLLEDDAEWSRQISRDCGYMGWHVVAVDNVPEAIALIESGNTVFDIFIADKGGSNSLRGKKDIIGHRDGLTVLRAMKELQPHCVRILATGENWSSALFTDTTLGLHMFISKGWYSDHRDDMYEKLSGWITAPDMARPIVYDGPVRNHPER